MGGRSKAFSCRGLSVAVVFGSIILALLPHGHCELWTSQPSGKGRRYDASGPFQNISAIIQKLTEDYDIRLRPNFGGDALEIGFDIIIASFDAVSEVNMDYTLTLYLNQYWRDERLSFGMEHMNTTLTLGGDFADLIWV